MGRFALALGATTTVVAVVGLIVFVVQMAISKDPRAEDFRWVPVGLVGVAVALAVGGLILFSQGQQG